MIMASTSLPQPPPSPSRGPVGAEAESLRSLVQSDLLSSSQQTEIALPVAAMKVLLEVIRRSTSSTMMGLQGELEEAKTAMLDLAKEENICGFRSHIPLQSGCELFMRYVTRCYLDFPNFTQCKREVLLRGEAFAGMR